MNIDQKISTTQFVNEQLSKYAGKVNFIPDAALIDALNYLEEKGIPNNKHEDYKYCNIEGILKKEFKSIDNNYTAIVAASANKYKVIEDCIHVFIINVKFSSELSDLSKLPKGLKITAIADAEKSLLTKHVSHYATANTDAFIALNTAYGGNGVAIHVEEGNTIKKAIHIINIVSASGNVFSNVRNLIVAEKNTSLTLIETFETTELSGKAFTNHLTEVILEEQAIIDSYRIQNECDHAYQVNTTQVHQRKNSNYTSNTYTFNGALVRNNLNVVIGGQYAEAHLNGLFVANGNQLVDNHTLVDHQQANCNSNELYKGVINDKATAVFNGKIYVRKDAQKTNAYQSSKNILLSDDGTINTKPQLEIYADDVKCSHGTSTGKIDEEAMFYLKSRGIGEENAKRLLMHAFAGEVIEKIKIESLKDYLEELININLK